MKSNPLQAVLCAPVRTKASERKPAATSTTTQTSAAPALGATRVMDFCKRYKISRWTFYAMCKRGDGPDFFKLGALTFISHAAEERWIKQREEAARAAPTIHRIAR